MRQSISLRKQLAGRELHDFITYEYFLTHPLVIGNTIEGRAFVQLTIDGVKYEAERVIKLVVKKQID